MSVQDTLTQHAAPPLATHEGPPYLAAALLCERAIEDREGIFSLVRLYDELTITVPEGTPEPSRESYLPLQLTLFIALKGTSDETWGPLDLRIVGPDGEASLITSSPVKPVPGKTNLNIHTQIDLGVSQAGQFWIEVIFKQRLMTRIPLLVALQRVAPSEFGIGLHGAAGSSR